MALTNSVDSKVEVNRLQNRIIDEIFFALGMRRSGLLRRLFGPLFLKPAHHFASIVAKYQAMVPEIGFWTHCPSGFTEFQHDCKCSWVGTGSINWSIDHCFQPCRWSGYPRCSILLLPQRHEDHGLRCWFSSHYEFYSHGADLIRPFCHPEL